MVLRIGLLSALAGAILLGAMSAGQAHAFLDHAAPAVGSTVAATPGEVRIWFTEAIEPAFSTIAVTDEGGRRVDQGKPERDPNDATMLRVAVAPLAPGTYKVTWHVVSVDTHSTQGNFTFRVAAR